MRGVLKVTLVESRPLPITLTFVSVLIGGLLAWRLGFQPKWDALLSGAVAAMLLNWADHPLDTLVDYYWRGEYELGYRSRFGDAGDLLKRGLASKGDLVASSSILYAVALPLLAYAISKAPVWHWPTLFAVMGVSLSILYALAGLDRVPVLGDLCFGTGVVSALLGGYFLVSPVWTQPIILLAGILYILILSAKIVDSLPDTHDAKIGKATIPTLIGYTRAKKLAYTLAGAFSLLLVLCYTLKLVPWVALVSALAPIPVWIYSYRLDPHSAEVPFFIGCLEAAIPLLLYLLLA